MLAKTMIAFCTTLVLATAFTTAAQARTRTPRAQAPASEQAKNVMPFTEFERMWFKQVEGNN